MTERKHIVFLTGFMGSGKSTIGPRLSRKIGYIFVDMDAVIEKKNGISIPEIFKQRGEVYFRETETATLFELSAKKDRLVIALGGGALTNVECRRLVKERGVLVYLQLAPEKIIERVGNDRGRPMLLTEEGRSMNELELSERVNALLRDREPHYLKADVVVGTGESTVSESVDEIASKLKGLIE